MEFDDKIASAAAFVVIYHRLKKDRKTRIKRRYWVTPVLRSRSYTVVTIF